ncbi:alpha/beta hydrolase [Chitinophaga pendula]|nr:alpha/beta hydrolase [Chitinophaga sp. MD30]UCJ10338.1 alpha/beta hydrolase [Chitinophaga pendula]
MHRHILALLILLLLHTALIAQKITPMDAVLSDYNYPYPVHFFSLKSQGQELQMAFMDVQPTQPNGKTILLLHGKNFCGAYWDSTAADLSQAGYRVIIPDQIGFGKSSKPPRLQYTFQLLAEQTKALLDSLKVPKTAILGHSMGGMLATRFTLMYPGLVSALILENPIGLEDWKLKVPYQSVDKWYSSELQQDYTKIKQYQLDNYYAGKWKPAFEKWATLLAGWTVGPDYAQVAWNAALTYDMIFTQPVCYEFSQIKVPTLLIIGQRDRTALGKANVSDAVRKTMGDYPTLGKETAQQITHAKLVPLEGVGHLPHIEAYQAFITPLLEFLQAN